MTYSAISIWGDSLARGILYNEQKQRYAISGERYTTRLQTTADCPITNHAMMGATVTDGFQSFLKSAPIPHALCAIEFGGNDCDLDWAYVSQHPQESITPKTALPLYQQTLGAFVTAVRERGMHPLLVTPLPLHAERYFRWVTRGLDPSAVLAALGDVNHIYRWQERYVIAMRNVAHVLGCKLLDMRDLFLARSDYESLMCIDGIHPNDSGYRVIADAVSAAALEDPLMPVAHFAGGTPAACKEKNA